MNSPRRPPHAATTPLNPDAAVFKLLNGKRGPVAPPLRRTVAPKRSSSHFREKKLLLTVELKTRFYFAISFWVDLAVPPARHVSTKAQKHVAAAAYVYTVWWEVYF